MTFDWAEYLALANKLRAEADEAAQRTAISRLYYSVFHQTRRYLEGAGVILSTMGPGNHQQIWNEFRRRGRGHKAVGNAGGQLQKYRVQADYSDQITGLEQSVEESFKLATQALIYLSQIQSKTQ